MKKRKKEIRTKCIFVFIAVLLIMSVSGANAYDLEVQNLPNNIANGGGSFTFDLLITNWETVDDLAGWQYQIDIVGRDGQGFVEFNFTETANTETNSKYIFYGDSFYYIVDPYAGDRSRIIGSDMAAGGSGYTDLPMLLSHLKVDYTASAYGIYDIVLGANSRNYIFDYDLLNDGTDPDIEYVTNFAGGSVAVIPEPISSILFLTGGVTFVFRHYRNRRRQS